MADIVSKEIATQANQQIGKAQDAAKAEADKAKAAAQAAADKAKAVAKEAADKAKAAADAAKQQAAAAAGAVTGALGALKGFKFPKLPKVPKFKPKKLPEDRIKKFAKSKLPNIPKVPPIPSVPTIELPKIPNAAAVGGLALQTKEDYSNAKANPLGTLYNRAIKPQIEKGISLIGEKNKSLATEISNRLNTAENKISSIPDVKSVSIDVVKKIIG